MPGIATWRSGLSVLAVMLSLRGKTRNHVHFRISIQRRLKRRAREPTTSKITSFQIGAFVYLLDLASAKNSG